MPPYTIEYRPAAEEDLADLPRRIRRAVRLEVDPLARDPRPTHALEMWGEWEGFLRLVVGEYRVIYRVDDRAERVIVVRARHRSESYDDPLSPSDC